MSSPSFEPVCPPKSRHGTSHIKACDARDVIKLEFLSVGSLGSIGMAPQRVDQFFPHSEMLSLDTNLAWLNGKGQADG